jgi:hypothetical protein
MYHDVDRIELQYFEYFIRAVAPSCTKLVAPDFWHRTIPQLSSSDKIIWNAVAAMAALIRCPQFSKNWLLPGRKRSAVTNDHHRMALHWYNNSLRELRVRLGAGNISSSLTLVTCLIYTCIECLQDNLEEAMVLYQQAVRIAFAQSESLPCSSGAKLHDGVLDAAAQALFRHMSISQGMPVAWKLRNPSSTYRSLSQAREDGYAMLAETHQFIVLIQEIKLTADKFWLPAEDHIDQWNRLKAKLLSWKAALDEFYCRTKAEAKPSEENEHYSTLMLACYHYYILLSTSLSTWETGHDSFLAEFRFMIYHARQVVRARKTAASRPVFAFETQTLPALHFVAIKCRHPVVRREAIQLLEHETPRMEYYFKADAMANVAKTQVGVEEAGGSEQGVFQVECAPGTSDTLPPEEHRIYRSKVAEIPHPISGESSQYLTYGMWRRGAEVGSWYTTEYVIKL